MAGFSSYDSIINAVTNGRRYISPFCKYFSAVTADSWYLQFNTFGTPGHGVWDSVPSGCVPMNSSTQGSYYTGPNVSPLTKHIIGAKVHGTGINGLTIVLIDMVAHYPIYQSASSQTFVNTNPPSRYVSAGQGGLQVALFHGATTGATASNLTTLTYVNQDGTAGRVIQTGITIPVKQSLTGPTTTIAYFNACSGGHAATYQNSCTSGIGLPLQDGDTGVTQLTDVTFSAANTGLHSFLLFRPLCYITLPNSVATASSEKNFISRLGGLERVFDDACLGFLFFLPVAATSSVTGYFDFAWN